MMWGLVNGKTQTDLPWGHRPEHGEYKGPWQHDIYHGDFTPYDQTEIDLLKNTANNIPTRKTMRTKLLALLSLGAAGLVPAATAQEIP